MRLHRVALLACCAAVASGALTPAFADDDWRWHQRHEWREQRQREEWRERAWREHEWRERRYAPPVLATPYGFYPPPPAFYPAPGTYR